MNFKSYFLDRLLERIAVYPEGDFENRNKTEKNNDFCFSSCQISQLMHHKLDINILNMNKKAVLNNQSDQQSSIQFTI